MPKFHITWSCFPTPVYAQHEIEAESLEAAREVARKPNHRRRSSISTQITSMNGTFLCLSSRV